MQTTKLPLGDIRHNIIGFDALVKFYAEASNCKCPLVEADMQATKWFDADMCAPFGALIENLKQRQIKVTLVNLQGQVEEILSKNGFLSFHGGETAPDTHHTTIAYQKFSVDDMEAFFSYVDEKFVYRRWWPELPIEHRKAFCRNVGEVFSNAVNHSNTKLGVFSCGQYFPTKERLNFTLVDLGIGIRQNIKDQVNIDYSSVEAIRWATNGNSTKPKHETGGMGLKVLCDALEKNEGCVRIVSDNGYWEKYSGKTDDWMLAYPFPGTVVDLEVNTANTKSLVLQSDLDADKIF